MGTWIYHLRPFPNQNPLKAGITQFFFLAYLYHQVSCTYAFFEEFYLMLTIFTEYVWTKYVSSEYSVIGYIIIVLLILLTLNTAIYNQDKYSGIRYLLSWVGIRVFPILRILLQINVALSAFFSIINKYCFVLFLITVSINLVATFLLQNYSSNKDYLMCGNITFSLIWRIVLYLNVVINLSIYWYQSQPYYNAVLTLRFVMMWCLWLIYILNGFNVYRRFVPRFILAGSMVVIICFSSSQFIDQAVYLLKLHNFYFDYAYMMSLYLPLTLTTFSIFSHKMNNVFESSDNKNLKNKLFFFKDKIDNFQNQIQTECFVRGLVLNHHNKKCANPDCYCHIQTHYDSKNNKDCDIKKIGVNKSIYSKLLMKSWYQWQLNDKILDQQIDFAEFLFLKLKNTFRSLIVLEECKERYQFPFQQLRIARLRKQIQVQNVRLNKELYNGALDIQFIIDCEKIFQKVKGLISDVLKNNRSFWSTVYNNKVDLTDLVRTVKPNIKTMETINDEWKLLSSYFDVQSKWKFYYAWYTLYVKNQKLKPVILQYFTTQVKQQDIFTDTNRRNKDGQIQSDILFQQLSAAIHICSSQKQTIKNVSNSFTKLFGYQQAQIIESPLEVLMTSTVSKTHSTMLHQWSYEAKSATYPNYHIRKVYIKHKSGQLIAANKHIKQLITPANQLQYVALLKTFDQQQNVLIADASMNIQGMTENLFKSLNFASIGLNHNYIKNINLSLIIPKLMKLSEYLGLLSDQDKYLFGIASDNKKKLKKMQSIYQNIKSPLKSFANLDSIQNQQIDTLCQFKITHGFREAVIDFLDKNSQALGKTNHINVIRQTVKTFRQQIALFKFSCKLNIIPKTAKDHKYYEITFTQLVNSNKSNITKSIMRRKEKAIPSLIASEFHKNFETAQNRRVFSLEYSNNIFIKQQNNKPMHKLFHIGILKQFGRLFFVAFLSTSLISVFVTYFINFNRYISISKQIAVIENIDLHTFYFENNLYEINYYNQNLLPAQYDNEQFFNNSVQNIQSTFFQLQDLKNTPQLKQTIFNTALNPLSKYGTTYNFSINSQSSSLNTNFDELDFIMKIFQMIELIRFSGFKDMNLTDWTVQFVQFYLTPAFQNILQTIQNNLFNYLHSTMNHSMKITVVIYVILAVTFVLAMIIAVYKITNIVESFISIIGVFTNFNQQDIQKIYKYSNFISNLFKYLKTKDRQQRTSIAQQQDPQSSQVNLMNNLTFDNKIYQTDNNNNININKKIKKIEIGSILNKIRLKTYGLIILTLVLFICGCFYCNTMIRTYNQRIHFLTNSGNQHFNYYTTLTRVQSAVNKKYTNSTTYEQYFIKNYQEQIETLKAFKNNNSRMIQSSKNFSFVDTYNIAYFQNVCKFLLPEDTSELQECETVSNNSLQFGIQSYVYYFTDKAIHYLDDSSPIYYSTIYQFQKGLRFVNQFMLKLTDLWLEQYQQTVDSSRNNILMYSVGILLGLVVIYLVLFELLTIRNLNIQYQTFRNIYEMYMPDYLVTKQKIIKAKLVTDGILDK